MKALANFETLIRFYWQAFIGYKNGENFKKLIEIFYQKLIISNVILVFLDRLKAKISSSVNHGRHRAPLLFKIFGAALDITNKVTSIVLIGAFIII